MIVPTYQSTRSPVQLLCITGDRVEISGDELVRFLTTPNFVLFLLTYCIGLILMGGQVYGMETATWVRTIFWPLNSAVIGALYAVLFWYCERRARKTDQHYLIFSLGIHVLTVMISVPIGAFILGWLHGVEVPFSTLSTWDFLKAILIAVIFEFAVVNWIWPAEAESWVMEEVWSAENADQNAENLRETIANDLSIAQPRLSLPYLSFR